VTGKAGVPNVTAAPKPTASPTDVVEYTCTRGDTGEQCCQRAPTPLHWCSGAFPNFTCYNTKNQFCCTDGTVCDEENCCELFVRAGVGILNNYSQTDAFSERLDDSPVGFHGHEWSHGHSGYHSCYYDRPRHATNDCFS